MAIRDEDKNIAWKNYHEKHLNKEFAWDKKFVLGRYSQAAVSPSVVSEMVKRAREVGVDMISDLVNYVLVKGVIPTEWKLSIFVIFYKGKGDALERENYRALK